MAPSCIHCVKGVLRADAQGFVPQRRADAVDFRAQVPGLIDMAAKNSKQKLFNGRDHSWMQFNRRVLEEAEDPGNPLLERVKFLAITGSNLDEYVEIRQAGLMQRIEDGFREPGYDGLRPDESLTSLTAEIHRFVED